MKKQQPQISEEKILETSWELLGEGGIETFSMRRLANRLGIQLLSVLVFQEQTEALPASG